MMLALILSSFFTVVQLNCENLFDYQNDSLKADEEFLPESYKHWTKSRYWRKLNNIGKVIIACGEDGERWKLPDVVGLCEVENDSVLRDLTQRSLLRKAGYKYVMTESPDERGIDVAFLYSPFTFLLVTSYALRVETIKGMRPTRDILYVKGRVRSGDSLHVFVVHAPSRAGGSTHTHPFRMQVAKRLGAAVDSIRSDEPHAHILLMGDFNDGGKAPALKWLTEQSLIDVSATAKGRNGAMATYRYQGEWESLDHIFVSQKIYEKMRDCYIYDADFLLEDDAVYGGKRPRRTYLGAKYIGGYSDHLPLVARFMW